MSGEKPLPRTEALPRGGVSGQGQPGAGLNPPRANAERPGPASGKASAWLGRAPPVAPGAGGRTRDRRSRRASALRPVDASDVKNAGTHASGVMLEARFRAPEWMSRGDRATQGLITRPKPCREMTTAVRIPPPWGRGVAPELIAGAGRGRRHLECRACSTGRGGRAGAGYPTTTGRVWRLDTAPPPERDPAQAGWDRQGQPRSGSGHRDQERDALSAPIRCPDACRNIGGHKGMAICSRAALAQRARASALGGRTPV